MADHECKRPTACRCWTGALEPADTCPVHSGGEWPPRCEECGKFMPWPQRHTEPVEGRNG